MDQKPSNPWACPECGQRLSSMSGDAEHMHCPLGHKVEVVKIAEAEKKAHERKAT